MSGIGFLSLLTLLLQTPSALAVIYGADNRHEAPTNETSRAIGMILNASIEHEDTYPAPFPLADGLRFLTHVEVAPHDLRGFIDQPRVGDCTSFLVGSDLMMTAGHCIQSAEECRNTQVVFDFFKPDITEKYVTIPSSSIYRCTELVSQNFSASDSQPNDYAIFRLDRPVQGRTPLSLSNAPIASLVNHPVSTLGFPRGVFMKAADHGQVLALDSGAVSFRTNLDTFSGNSGSPIFDDTTGKVIGILISGSWDDNGQTVDGHYSQVDVAYSEFPKPGDRQITQIDPLLGEQAFFIGNVLKELHGH